MKEIRVTNRDSGEPIQRDGFSHMKMTSDVLSKIGAMQVDIEPGRTAFSYHYHEGCEELFYIVRGAGKIRTCRGDIDVKEGDFISFPTGEEGAHVIRNTSDTVLTYINFHNVQDVGTGYFPDTGEVMIIDPHGMRRFKEE